MSTDNRATQTAECWCRNCRQERAKGLPMMEAIMLPIRFACEVCGNKRCPHNSDHRLACTASNSTGQPGSIYQ